MQTIKLENASSALLLHLGETIKIIQTGDKNCTGCFNFKGKAITNEEPDGFIVLADIPHELEWIMVQVGIDNGQATRISNLGTAGIGYCYSPTFDYLHWNYVGSDRPISLQPRVLYLHWKFFDRATNEEKVVCLTVTPLPEESGIIISYELLAKESNQAPWPYGEHDEEGNNSSWSTGGEDEPDREPEVTFSEIIEDVVDWLKYAFFRIIGKKDEE